MNRYRSFQGTKKMEEKRLVAEWLLEYACYHHMTSVLHGKLNCTVYQGSHRATGLSLPFKSGYGKSGIFNLVKLCEGQGKWWKR